MQTSALRFTTLNSDIAPLTPTGNPRSQLVSPAILRQGYRYWESFEVYLPSSFPSTQPAGGWISLGTPFYGYPFDGTPPIEISIVRGAFRYQLNGYGPHPWAIAWTEPEVRNRWVRFTWHFLAARRGWVELFVDGRQVGLHDGAGRIARRLPLAVIDPTDDHGPWFADLQLYYQHNDFPSLTADFRGFRIATTRAFADQ